MIEMYTDGACSGNPGPGGWAAIIVDGGKRREMKGYSARTTSNRMELTAAIEGLASIPEESEVRLWSDSQYLINTMTLNWKRRANTDLWARLDSLAARRKIEWVWIQGHAGHSENERADRIASQIAAGGNPVDPPASVPCAPSEPPEPSNAAGNESSKPSHFDASGQVHMVDVSPKQETDRVAVAKGMVTMKAATLDIIAKGEAAKGDVLAVAQTAGIMAAKRTSDLIPLCHPLRLTSIAVEFSLDREKNAVEIIATVKADEKTGVEMEALTAVAASALTIYDMCKAVDRGMRIEAVRLVHKSGGKSGTIDLP